MKNINLLLSTLLLGGVIMNCGGGGGSDIYKKNDNNKPPVNSATLINLKGALADGYISGGNVEIRYSGLSVVKTESNSNGEYVVKIPSDATKVEVLAKGGIDKDTDEVFEGLIRSSFVLESSNDKIWTTPITTILASLVDDGKSQSDARDIINTHLGFESGFDLLKTNPLGGGLSDERTIKIFKATQQIQRVSEIIKDALGSDIGYNDISKAIARVMISDNGSDNLKEILKSSKLNSSVVALVSDDKKAKVKERLDGVKLALASIVDLIDSADISVDKIKLYSKSIELVSSSYELKASEINVASDGSLLIDLRSDFGNIIKTYTSLSAVNVLVLKAQALAEADGKVVSLYQFSRSITKMISTENNISELDKIHTKINIADSVITDAEKAILTAKITAGIVIELPVNTTPIPVNDTNTTTPQQPADTKLTDIIKKPSQDGGSVTINGGNQVPGIPSDNVGTISNSIENKQPDYNDGTAPENKDGRPPQLGHNTVPSL